MFALALFQLFIYLAAFSDRHHISKGFRLEKVFATLLRYKIQDNINIPTEVVGALMAVLQSCVTVCWYSFEFQMDWMLSHPSHSTSQILFINTILELGPPSRTDQVRQQSNNALKMNVFFAPVDFISSNRMSDYTKVPRKAAQVSRLCFIGRSTNR